MAFIPNFSTATFTPGTPINNPYLPLIPGTIFLYQGESQNATPDERDREINQVAATYQTQTISGVEATVVRDTSWVNGLLEEDTTDWYAQDTNGNVWYLGEASTGYQYDDDGNFIGTSNDGSWKTGVNGAVPGYAMEANPQVGDRYYQEFSPNDEAVDEAEIISRTQAISTGLGNFGNVLQTLESTAAEPGALEYKYYAQNIGLVLVEEGLDNNLQPDFVSELVSTRSVTADAFNNGHGTSGNDTLDGDTEGNTLRAGRGDDFAQGFAGSDRLLGQDGNDFLSGGSKSDLLDGGDGDDILVGGQGVDTMKGGKGRDQFVFRTLQDRGDRIKDFSRRDVIVLAEIFDSPDYGSTTPFEDYVQIKQVGSSTVIRIDADGDAGSSPFKLLARLPHTHANLLTDANFVF